VSAFPVNTSNVVGPAASSRIAVSYSQHAGAVPANAARLADPHRVRH